MALYGGAAPLHRQLKGLLLPGLPRGRIVQVGEGCERMLTETIKGVAVQDVQADELFTFIHCKQRTREQNKVTVPDAGDAYCYIAMERTRRHLMARPAGVSLSSLRPPSLCARRSPPAPLPGRPSNTLMHHYPWSRESVSRSRESVSESRDVASPPGTSS